VLKDTDYQSLIFIQHGFTL